MGDANFKNTLQESGWTLVRYMVNMEEKIVKINSAISKTLGDNDYIYIFKNMKTPTILDGLLLSNMHSQIQSDEFYNYFLY